MEKEIIIKTIVKELSTCKETILSKFKNSGLFELFDLVYVGEDFEKTINSENTLEDFLQKNTLVKICIYFPFEIVYKGDDRMSLPMLENMHEYLSNSIIYNKVNSLITERFTEEIVRKLIRKSVKGKNEITDPVRGRVVDTENEAIGIPTTDWYSYYITSELENVLYSNPYFYNTEKDVLLININNYNLDKGSFLHKLLNHNVSKEEEYFYGDTPTTLVFNTDKVESSDYHNKYRELTKKLSIAISNFEEIQKNIIKSNQEVFNIKEISNIKSFYHKDRINHLFKLLSNSKVSSDEKEYSKLFSNSYGNNGYTWQIPPLTRGRSTTNISNSMPSPSDRPTSSSGTTRVIDTREDRLTEEVPPPIPAVSETRGTRRFSIGNETAANINNIENPRGVFNININTRIITTQIHQFVSAIETLLRPSSREYTAISNTFGYVSRASIVSRNNPTIIRILWDLKLFLGLYNSGMGVNNQTMSIMESTTVTQNDYNTFIDVIQLFLARHENGIPQRLPQLFMNVLTENINDSNNFEDLLETTSISILTDELETREPVVTPPRIPDSDF